MIDDELTLAGDFRKAIKRYGRSPIPGTHIGNFLLVKWQ